MKNTFQTTAEKYLRALRQKHRHYKLVAIMAAIVMASTAYALILPAITQEKICELPEHSHSGACFEQVLPDPVLICDIGAEPGEDGTVHQHGEECFEIGEPQSVCVCGLTEHTHGSDCTSAPEENAADSTDSSTDGSIDGTADGNGDENVDGNVDGNGDENVDENVDENPNENSDQNTDSNTTVADGDTTDDNSNPTDSTPTDGDTSENEAAADKPADTTGDNKTANSSPLAQRIAAIPSMDEIAAELTALEESGDTAAWQDYYSEMSRRVLTAYAYYEELPATEQEQLVERDKLTSLADLFAADALAAKSSFNVYQINKYSEAATVLVWDGSVQSKLGAGMSFTYWDALIIEQNSAGKLYVANHVGSGTDKRNYAPSTDGGFILLLYKTTVSASVGDTVSASFNYRTTAAYNAQGYGIISIGETGTVGKPEKDNSEFLSTADSADTDEFITINLYNYGSNINDKYNSDHKYPGFQQEYGTPSIGSALNAGSFNYGNSITADLAAGIDNLTNKGGTINQTTNHANRPIEGAMLRTLKNGYPALADGTSLSYLFSDNIYASKQNRSNINGLFILDKDTGAYTFNSRTHHAQFNSADSTFTLYEQLLSPNFMMYPFGNFLPFNDIVHQAAKATDIDKEYLSQIAASAANRSAGNDAYSKLSTNLYRFIDLMDSNNPKGWDAITCVDGYFSAANVPNATSPKKFSEAELANIYSIDYDEATDFYFGMDMSLELMQPKDGYTGTDGKQPMIFYFTGDDDVWVYVDNVLFLDLSGIHRHVGGEINFVDGTVKYYDLDVNTGDVATTPYKTVRFSDLVSSDQLNSAGTFKNYSHHSFNFYYMERGSGSGVCRMNFNFPLLHKNSISVTKELGIEQGTAATLGNPDFSFQVLREDGKELFIGAGVPYELTDIAGNKLGEGQTDANGVFKIKANQIATFSDIAENSGKYIVRELLDSNAFAQYGTVSVNNSAVASYQDVSVGGTSYKAADSSLQDVSDGSTVFRFTNRVDKEKLGSLSITKELSEYPSARTLPAFDFEVTLDEQPLPIGTKYTVGSSERTVTTAGIITVRAGETATVNGILANTAFTVKESAASSEGYVVNYKLNGQDLTAGTTEVSGIIQNSQTAAIVATNIETGVQITIPVEKRLTAPDGVAHSYTLRLEQVSDQEAQTAIQGGFTQEKQVSVTKEPVSIEFTIPYATVDLGELPQVFYYKILEPANAEDTTTEYDTTYYVVEVTVQYNDDGDLTAAITNRWRGTTALTDNDNISFNNTIIRYELPQTGGPGTIVYSVCCLLPAIGAAVCLRLRRREQKEVQ